MSVHERIGTLAALVGIATAAIGGAFGVWQWRASAIDQLRTDLAQSWTNEGDVTSTETNFIHLMVALEHGDLSGTLASPQSEIVYDVTIDPGWHSASAHISFVQGPRDTDIVSIADVKLVVKGNHNRLLWKIESRNAPSFLPLETELWPE